MTRHVLLAAPPAAAGVPEAAVFLAPGACPTAAAAVAAAADGARG